VARHPETPAAGRGRGAAAGHRGGPWPRRAAAAPAQARAETRNDDAERRRLGLAVMFRPADPAGGAQAPAASRRAKAEGGAAVEGGPRIPAFCLFDPPRRLALFGRRRARTCPPHAAPRIIYPGLAEPHRLPPPPGPHDPINAGRVIARIASLSAALDDLPGQARRFARWKARSAAARRRDAGGEWKPRRLTPIRRGRLPGGRLWRFDPVATRPANIREVDEILAHAHALATYALDYPDTS
jgi:hypothetical protein